MLTKIHNIKSLVTYDDDINDVVIQTPKNIIIKDDRIDSVNFKDIDFEVDSEINANNTILSPGFIDSHTHLIFASNRADDFSKRISGQSYIDIANSGGGIKSSINSFRKTSKEEIVKDCEKKISYFLKNGTTTIEVKSGYGLSLEDELKSLNILKELNNKSDVGLISTFMGAHDFPPEIKDKESYVDLICNEMIPEVRSNNLAEFCDVFCEQGYFDINQTLKISQCANDYNLKMKLHADEFNDSGAAFIAGEINAVSADHLMQSNEPGLRNMAKNNVVATILPATTLFLGMKTYANARRMIDYGCDIAVASDYNPGSNTIYSIPSVMALATLYCGLTINEVFKAVTFNAAKALNRSHFLGMIKKDYIADILFWDINSINEIPYWFNSDRLTSVMKNGKLVFQNEIN
tara:strand:+ start:11893 stop:13110 length:1218 start_codon:yes stop_codon:yes gene_type:complete